MNLTKEQFKYLLVSRGRVGLARAELMAEEYQKLSEPEKEEVLKKLKVTYEEIESAFSNLKTEI